MAQGGKIDLEGKRAARRRNIRRYRSVASVFSLFSIAMTFGGALAARADDYSPRETNSTFAAYASTSDLIVTIGGWGNISPEYSGSKHYDFGGSPIIDIRHVGSREWLSLPSDGIDYELFETDNFRAGPVGTLRWDFGNSKDRGLKEVGNTGIDLSLELGVFLEYWPTDFWRTRLEARNAVYGATGWVFDLSTDLVWHPSSQWTLAAGPRLSIADSDYMNSYYGIDAQESQQLHLPKYDAAAGVRSAGAGIYAEYKVTEQLTTMASFEYERLVGSAADSPYVRDDGSPDQFTISLGAKYQFLWQR
ncbi:MipA/OmpV family protein [Hyphomicrobium sp.]|uniref:MipA/OmpV family protein n=1 Tax=Hyphomicrobium sp. TaxID=82 RepID=UPI0025B95080|nr:MipA/OmpV family protein [Hyphomicrobium sp.]